MSSEQWHYVHVPKNSVGYLLGLESYYYRYMYMYMLALSPKDETTFHGVFPFRQFYSISHVSRLLTYKPQGSKVTLDIMSADVECLEPGEYLNDKIIDFYLK